MAGSEARSLPPFSHVPGQLSSVGLWSANIRPGSRPCALSTRVSGHTSTASGVYMLVRGHQRGHLLLLAPFGHALPLHLFGP